MRYKIYLILLLLTAAQFVRAQSDFLKTDSISNALYHEGKWEELIQFGKNAIANGDDFPALRLRIAYAAFEQQKYGLALTHYQQVLKADHYNQTALAYSYLCNRYLNRPKEATFFTDKLLEKPMEGLAFGKTALTIAGVENVVKTSAHHNRGTALYHRIFAQLKTAYNFHIDYSASFYHQKVDDNTLSQPSSYLKLNYMPVKNLSVLGAWNYTNTEHNQIGGETNILLLGIKYAQPYYLLQGDASISKNGTENTTQTNLSFVTYLSGNLNFYLANRLSYLNVASTNWQTKYLLYNPTIGLMPFKNVWTEFGATFGEQYQYTEADGLYLYNSPDITKFKFLTSVYFLAKKHLLLGLGYSFEKKTDNGIRFNYSQHGINTSIGWNF